ncbi:MAG: tetratricopeptide repeat protein [Pseudomonadota bacterium]|jgi:predicted Zn-dependent protease
MNGALKVIFQFDSGKSRGALCSLRGVYWRGTSLACLLAAGLTGCSVRSGDYSPNNTVAVDVANAKRSDFQADARRDSAAMHHFLVGQLELGEEEYDSALKNFKKSEQLALEPQAVLYTRLADLYLRFGQLKQAESAAKSALDADPSEAYTRMLYAGVLEALGRDAQAEPIYRELVDRYPAKPDGYLLLANLYLKNNRLSDAAAVLINLIKARPDEPLGHFYLGRVYEQQERYDRAEREYYWVFDRDPELTNAAPELIRVLARQNKTVKIKQVCDRIIQHDPDNALARKVLSHIMIGESKLDEALKHLTALESLEDDPSETRFKVALIQIEKQNYREAIRELNLVLAKNPKHAEARYYLASVYAGSGMRKEAISELERIDKDSSIFVKAKTFAAFILRQDDRLREAARAIDDALKIEPDNIGLILYSVLVARDRQDLSGAERRLRDALKKKPDDERLLFNLAVVLHDRENDEQALQVMERIIVTNPKNTDALNFVAYSLAERGVELARAEKLVGQALEIRPNDGYFLDTLGYVYLRQGRIDEAEQTLARAVSATGQDTVIIEHYVEVLLLRGERKRAASIMKSVTEQELSKEDERDIEKKRALERLKQRLDELVERYPELREVESSRLIKTGQQRQARRLAGTELFSLDSDMNLLGR